MRAAPRGASLNDVVYGNPAAIAGGDSKLFNIFSEIEMS
jgi:hypothetical protein